MHNFGSARGARSWRHCRWDDERDGDSLASLRLVPGARTQRRAVVALALVRAGLVGSRPGLLTRRAGCGTEKEGVGWREGGREGERASLREINVLSDPCGRVPGHKANGMMNEMAIRSLVSHQCPER